MRHWFNVNTGKQLGLLIVLLTVCAALPAQTVILDGRLTAGDGLLLSTPELEADLSSLGLEAPAGNPGLTFAETLLLQPVTGSVAGLGMNLTMVGAMDLVTLLILFPLYILPGGLDSGSLYAVSHYTLVASTMFLYPLLTSVGIRGYGEVLERGGTPLTVLFTYSAEAVGVIFYLLGYYQVAAIAMLAAPPIVGTISFHFLSRDLDSGERPRQSGFIGPNAPEWMQIGKRLVTGVLGGAGGSAGYLGARWQARVMSDLNGTFESSADGLLDSGIGDCLLFLPLSSSAFMTALDRLTGNNGSLLWSMAGSLLGSCAGWGLSALMDVPAFIPAAVGASIGGSLTMVLTDLDGADDR
jgi:hypothetical protein